MEAHMFAVPRKLLCFTLALSLVLLPALQAQQTNPTTAPALPVARSSAAAPIPQQILSAHAVFVSNGGGSNFFDEFTGGPDRAYNTFYADMQRSGRYTLVNSPSQADLIFEVHSIAPTSGFDDNVGPNPQLILSILDPKTQTVLWTTSVNVLAIGRQKSRDRQFDQCVAVLEDKLAQVTGQPLTPEQVKAVNSNSRMPTAAKVIIIVSVVGSAALLAFILYKATHPLAPPTMPTLMQPVP
jgi:hypothetical protein